MSCVGKFTCRRSDHPHSPTCEWFIRTTRMRRIRRILRRKTPNPSKTPIALAGSRITTPHNPNLISPPYPRFKQALNRPVFSLAKPPDKQTELITGFSVTLVPEMPETGRSLRSGTWETGLISSPDRLFSPIRAGESTVSLLLGDCQCIFLSKCLRYPVFPRDSDFCPGAFLQVSSKSSGRTGTGNPLFINERVSHVPGGNCRDLLDRCKNRNGYKIRSFCEQGHCNRTTRAVPE